MTAEKTYKQQLEAAIREAKWKNLLTLSVALVRQAISAAIVCAAIGFLFDLDLDAYPDLLLAGMPVGIAVFMVIAMHRSDNRHAELLLRHGFTWQTSPRTILRPPAKPDSEPDCEGPA
ncbi:hypothetical protein [Nonomuraea jabiensis]|uniref:hypothetical protein n=1 Tax=Nonomuraea jabiensis TaxID=882448 RepID=UPI0036C6AD9F